MGHIDRVQRGLTVFGNVSMQGIDGYLHKFFMYFVSCEIKMKYSILFINGTSRPYKISIVVILDFHDSIAEKIYLSS